MRILVDSNVLCRLARRDDPQHEEARQAVRIAIEQGTELFVCPQVEREFWAVATRLRAENGLGMTPQEAAASLRDWRESVFQFSPDSPAVHATWEKLVAEHDVCGKQVHDAAIVAAAKAAGMDQVLTFNREHFQRFEREIAITTPREIIQEHQRTQEREQAPTQQQSREHDHGIER